MKVEPVADERLDVFVDLPARLNANDPLWVPPMRAIELVELRGQDQFGSYATIQPFLCESGSEAIGRVAAVLNPRLTDKQGRPMGQVGYFACVNDDEASTRLFDAAFDWLEEQGVTRVLGPMNGGAHRAHRLMTDGFEQRPFLFEPRNPPFYVRLFEQYGFEECAGWNSYDLDRADLERLSTWMAKLKTRVPTTYREEPLDPAQPEALLRRLYPMTDALWAGHLGFAPLELPEFIEVFQGLVHLVEPRQVGVIHDHAHNRDVAVAVMYPDYADQVRAIAGDVTRWGEWLGSARPRRDVLHTVAVMPEARRTAAPALLVHGGLETWRQTERDGCIVALVVDTWKTFSRLRAPTRSYALYRKAL